MHRLCKVGLRGAGGGMAAPLLAYLATALHKWAPGWAWVLAMSVLALDLHVGWAVFSFFGV